MSATKASAKFDRVAIRQALNLSPSMDDPVSKILWAALYDEDTETIADFENSIDFSIGALQGALSIVKGMR